MKTAIVTGGTGTISSGMVEVLSRNGYTTYAITRGNKWYREVEKVNYIYADIRKHSEIIKNKLIAERDYDVVVECQAYTVDQLKASLSLFGNHCGIYVFISTAGIYRKMDEHRFREDDLADLKEWSYTRDKILCEEYLREYCMETGLKYMIIRPPVVYGNYRVPYPVVSRQNFWSLMQRMVDKKPIVSCNVEPVVTGILHISDFSNMVMQLIENKNAMNEEFHITDLSCEYFWDDIVHEIEKVLEIKSEIVHIPICVFKTTNSRMYDELYWNKIHNWKLDDSKLRKYIEYKAQMPLSDGIRHMVNNLKYEYENYNTTLDEGWNRCCDHTILVAYSLGYIMDSEREIVNKYIQNLKRTVYM